MDFKHLLLSLPLLGALSAQAQAQPKTASRLIAEATSVHNSTTFMLSDSTYMKYSNDRGGDLEHTMKYDLRHMLVYNPGTASYANMGRMKQTWDAKSNMLTYTEEYWDAPSSQWINSQKFINEYDTFNNMITHITQVWNVSSNSWLNISRERHLYNGDIFIDTVINQSWNSFSNDWQNQTLTITSYDLNNDPAIETMLSWNGLQWTNAQRTLITFINKMETSRISQFWNGSTWVNQIRYTHEYDTAGNMLNEIYSTWNNFSSVWDNSSKTAYTYDQANNMTEKLEQFWDFGTNNWRNSANSVYSYDTSKNNILQIDQIWNNATNFFQNVDRFRRTYNANHQMTTQVADKWNIGGFWENRSGDQFNRYYYETYTLDIPATAKKLDANLNIYPVPANNMLHIELGFTKPQAFTAAIISITGKVIRQWGEQPTASYSKSINVNDLPAGNYILKVNTAEGQTVSQFAVTH
jgi:hypothetical protein